MPTPLLSPLKACWISAHCAADLPVKSTAPIYAWLRCRHQYIVGWSADPRSRGLNAPTVFLCRGYCIPRGVKAQCITEQQMMGLDTIYLLDLLFTYPELDEGHVG